MKFSDNSSGSLDVPDLLPRVAEFVAHSMSVEQVAFWLRSPTVGAFHLAYCHEGAAAASRCGTSALLLDRSKLKSKDTLFFRVPAISDPATAETFPVIGSQALDDLGVERLVLVEKSDEVLAMIGIGAQRDEARSFAEDEQILSSVSNELGHLILTDKLSQELLLAREWDSFNRFAAFILHDLKNLATLQGMTLENARQCGHDPEFVADAFATFGQTTEKMIALIASLSVPRGQFCFKRQPVDILKVIARTLDALKIEQRNGVQMRTAFPPQHQLPAVSGDAELLEKAFTNLLLNAIQSLPQGQGTVEVTVAHEPRGKITVSIRDTGCGIAPERLDSLFRPFQTTKEKGLGIGLCHTRSIIEVHGGQIRIESPLNAGTKVEVELPTL